MLFKSGMPRVSHSLFCRSDYSDYVRLHFVVANRASYYCNFAGVWARILDNIKPDMYR